MLSSFLSLSALAAATATAFPLQLAERSTFNNDNYLNITYSSPRNESLPNVLILATGGTIAGSSSSDTDATEYQAGSLGVGVLVDAVPQLLNVSNIDAVQVSNVGSGDVTSDLVLDISQKANYALCRPDANYTGVVITHGTDTLEETAFAMDISVNCDKPVVVVGAMRPATAISADGPANLLQGVTVAADPQAKGRGALIVLNDRIGQAWYTEKTNANTLDTFKAPEQGYVGGLLSFQPFYYFPPSQPTFKQTFDTSSMSTLPMVDIIYCHQDYDVKLIEDALDNGAQGLVLAGTGAGDVAAASAPYLEKAQQRGVPVVVSTKINVGAVVPATSGDDTYIGAGFLNPVKSRIQLQFALASGCSKDQIRENFEGKLSSCECALGVWPNTKKKKVRC